MIKQLDTLGQEIFEKRYAYPGDKTWSDRAKAIAKNVASAEKDEDKEKWYDKFYASLASGDFVPGGRIIYGSGRKDQNLLNCYQISPDDNVKSISKVLSDMYRISCGGGGIGFNFSNIRPKGDDIGNVKNSAPGSVSVTQMINEVGNHVKAGKNRRTALIAILNVTHPDLLDFLTIKLDQKQLNNFNISVGITDRFLEAVNNDEEWYFTFNNKKYYVFSIRRIHNSNHNTCTSSIVDVAALSEEDALERARQHFKLYFDDELFLIEKKLLKARDIWNFIFANSVECGDPGFYHVDLANRFTNVSYFEYLPSPNPSLKGETRVLTDKGAIPIKELVGRDFKYLTFDGKWSDGECRLSGKDKQLWEIEFSNGKKVYCTKEHKWPILKRNKNYIRDNKPSIDYKLINKVETSNIQPLDLIYLPENLNIDNKNCEFTQKDGFVLGWNIGDGWRSWHKQQNNFIYGFIFSEEDTDSGIAEFVKDFINNKLSLSSNLRENKGCYELYYGSSSIRNYFDLLGNKGKKDGIPETVFRGSKDYIAGFIDGLISSDGHIDSVQDRVCLTTTHEKLAKDFQTLMLLHGISSNITVTNINSPFKCSKNKIFTSYRLSISGIMAKRFASKWTLSHQRKNSKLLEIEKKNYYIVNNREYLRVKSVKETSLYEDVYDITVFDNTHTFAMETGLTSNCGEIPLPNYGNCCLGHINLSNMIDENDQLDWKKLARTVRTGVRFLDNILTVNHFPIEECKEVGHNSRRIGLGVLGVHYMLIKLGLRYGSDKCLEFLDRLHGTIRNETYLESAYIAREKGAFPAFDYKKFLSQEFAKTLPARVRMLIKEHGIRNAVMLTIAPTGTISMVMGTSSGIEPIFSWAYKRRFRDGNVWKETIVVDPLFREYYNKYGPGGFDYSIFAGAYDVTPKEHLAVQATIQKYIDNSISKTINLPADSNQKDKIKQLSDVALEYMPYLKGLTVYRSSSKGNEPLEAIPLTDENVEKYMELYNKQEVKESKLVDGAACSLNGGECGN